MLMESLVNLFFFYYLFEKISPVAIEILIVLSIYLSRYRVIRFRLDIVVVVREIKK